MGLLVSVILFGLRMKMILFIRIVIGSTGIIQTDVTAPTTKVVGFLEPLPVPPPYGAASVAQQTPARV